VRHKVSRPVFVESVPFPPEHEKECIDVTRPGDTVMHFVTRRYHWMQKHKFGVRCPNAFFVESVLVPPEQEK
jgi:hypothetical protein